MQPMSLSEQATAGPAELRKADLLRKETTNTKDLEINEPRVTGSLGIYVRFPQLPKTRAEDTKEKEN